MVEQKEFRWFGINTGPVALSYWGVGEPYNPVIEPCIILWKGHEYYWGDMTCVHKAFFLCEQRNM